MVCLDSAPVMGMIRRWVIHRVVLITTDADHAAFGDGLFLVGFTGMVFDMGVKLTICELKSELTLAHVNNRLTSRRVSRSRRINGEVSSVSWSPTSAELPWIRAQSSSMKPNCSDANQEMAWVH